MVETLAEVDRNFRLADTFRRNLRIDVNPFNLKAVSGFCAVVWHQRSS